jgi:tRNA modification GTPase
MVADLRQQASLEKAAESLARARDGLAGGLPAELIALEIRDALDALGEITGKTTPEEILERIFANFCLGK